MPAACCLLPATRSRLLGQRNATGGEDKVKSPNFKRFEDLCCELFLQLRDNASLFLTLMSLMFEAGLPEVRRL